MSEFRAMFGLRCARSGRVVHIIVNVTHCLSQERPRAAACALGGQANQHRLSCRPCYTVSCYPDVSHGIVEVSFITIKITPFQFLRLSDVFMLSPCIAYTTTSKLHLLVVDQGKRLSAL